MFVVSFFVTLQSVNAASGPVPLLIIDSNGTSHPITDITTLTSTVGWGGYKTPSGALNSGYFQGVSLLNLCNSIGTSLTSNQNVTVQTSSGSSNITFDYDQVASGINISPQYSTYNNVTGTSQAPSAGNPVTLIEAYENANGTALPGSGTITRLMIVGPEGLLFQGQGLAGVTNITITNNTPTSTPTPTPSLTPTPTPMPTASPTPTAIPTTAPTATTAPTTPPTPIATPTPSASPSPSGSPTPLPSASASNPTFLLSPIGIALVVVIIIIVITGIVAVFSLRKRT